MLLHGVRTVGGPIGERPDVAALPGSHDPAMLFARLAAYVRDPSALGIERILRGLDAAGVAAVEIERQLLDLATRPQFLDRGDILRALVTTLIAGERLSADGGEGRVAARALTSWTLGTRSAQPEAQARQAMAWLDERAARLGALAAAPTKSLSADEVAAGLDATDSATLFDRVLAWLEAGVGFAALVDVFSLVAARRAERIAIGSGGLLDSAMEAIRLCRALRRAVRRADGRWQQRAPFVIAWHFFTTRWLQPGRIWQGHPPAAAPAWETYEAAVQAGDAIEARAQAVALIDLADGGSLDRWLAPLVDEDLGGAQLDVLAAAVEAVPTVREWQPYVAAATAFVIDGKLRRDVRSAARFGASLA